MVPSYINMPHGSAIVRVAKSVIVGVPKAGGGGGKHRAFRASVRSDNDSDTTEETFFQSEAAAYVGNE